MSKAVLPDRDGASGQHQEDIIIMASVGGGVKRERSMSLSTELRAPTPFYAPRNVYKTLALRVGGDVPISLDSISTSAQSSTAADVVHVSIVDVVPYMWGGKPLDETLKLILNFAVTNNKIDDGHVIQFLTTQVEQLNRRFTLMWKDCVFSRLSEEEALSKVSLDPQAWLIAETAMEVVLQITHPTLHHSEVQETLKKYRSMMPLEVLLNPATGGHAWARVAYLINDHCNSRDQYRVLQASRSIEGRLRKRMEEHHVPHGDIQ